MSSVAVIDASVLLFLAKSGLFSPRWSATIQDEWTNAVLTNQSRMKYSQLHRARSFMEQEFPDASVDGFEPPIAQLTLPDPDDRHVLAAAIHAQAEIIVTMNLKHFPKRALAAFGIKPIHPDKYVCSLIERETAVALEAFAADRSRFRKPPKDRDG